MCVCVCVCVCVFVCVCGWVGGNHPYCLTCLYTSLFCSSLLLPSLLPLPPSCLSLLLSLTLSLSLCSHQLLKQIMEVDGGAHKGGGRGSLDPKLREGLVLFRLTTDAMVKVQTFMYMFIHVNSYTCTCTCTCVSM